MRGKVGVGTGEKNSQTEGCCGKKKVVLFGGYLRIPLIDGKRCLWSAIHESVTKGDA